MKRRSFIEFLGKGMIAVPLLQVGLQGCGGKKSLTGIDPSQIDDLILTEGLDYKVLIRWGDKISSNDYFGFNNDYIAYLGNDSDSGLLWVNHEDVSPLFVSRFTGINQARTRKMIQGEMYNVGGTFMKVERNGGVWEVVESDQNRRITAMTEIPFEWPEPVKGSNTAIGTLANCSGGITPWGTILTCEENYHNFYGDFNYVKSLREPSMHSWESFYNYPPEHYGWVVEVDPNTGDAKKHVGLGRFAHECATVHQLPDERVVVYSGDDQNGGCLYKFIADEPNTLYPGKLYVANLEAGSWELMDLSRPELQDKFENQTEMLIRSREAAKYVGGTPLDRPEDIEIDPITGDVIISLTNNKPKGNYFGSLLRITEQNGYDGMSFAHDTLAAGGEETGFACPDNLAYDLAGNLWFTSDISGSSLGKAPYEAFGNNGLYVLIRNGEQAGKIIQVASAPIEAELTGPYFSPDGRTLFLSVQHPGSRSTAEKMTSNWPDGGDNIPRPAVVAIQGDFLEQIQNVV